LSLHRWCGSDDAETRRPESPSIRHLSLSIIT